MAREYLDWNNTHDIYYYGIEMIADAIVRDQTIEALGEEVVEHIQNLDEDENEAEIHGGEFLYAIERDRSEFYEKLLKEAVRALKDVPPAMKGDVFDE